MRPPTEDDYVGMAPCEKCQSFPEPEPWYRDQFNAAVLVHLSMHPRNECAESEEHRMSREKFNKLRAEKK